MIELVCIYHPEKVYKIYPGNEEPPALRVDRKLYGDDYICKPEEVENRIIQLFGDKKKVYRRSLFIVTYPDGCKTTMPMRARDVSEQFQIFPASILVGDIKKYTLMRGKRAGFTVERVPVSS